MVAIKSRAEWGFDGWLNGINPYTEAITKRDEFFIHFNGGTPTNEKAGASNILSLHKDHRNRGWAGVGYNFIVTQDGTIWEGRGWNFVGAHCPNHNRRGLGVQVHIGGAQKPSEAALKSVLALYKEACKRAGRILAKKGHRDGIATTCPGEALYKWVKDGFPVDSPTPAKPTPAPSKPAPKPQTKPKPKQATKTPARPWLITSQKGVYLDQLKRGVTGSTSVYLYQLALRRYLNVYANKYNPNGATGNYFSETEAMTDAVYRDLAAKAIRKSNGKSNGGWLQGDTRYPGTGLLKVLGVTLLGLKAY